MAEAILPTHTAVEAPPAAVPLAGACFNCSAPMSRAYCAECGQRAWRGRLTLRSIATHQLTDALDLDRGLLFTFLELFRHPGAVVRDYVRGRMATYSNPLKYFLVIGALTTLVYVKTGVAGAMASSLAAGMSDGSAGEIHPRAGAILEFISSYFTLLMATTIPTTALASRLVFRKARYNYAEHLVFATYVGAQQSVIVTAVLLAGAAAGGDPNWVLQWSFLPITAYYAWAAAEFTGGVRLSSLLRALCSSMLSFVFFILAFGVVGVFVGIGIALTK